MPRKKRRSRTKPTVKPGEKDQVTKIVVSTDPVVMKRLELVMDMAGIPLSRAGIVYRLTTANDFLTAAGLKPVKSAIAYLYIRAALQTELLAVHEKNRDVLVANSLSRKNTLRKRALQAGDYRAAQRADESIDLMQGLANRFTAAKGKAAPGVVTKITFVEETVDGGTEDEE